MTVFILLRETVGFRWTPPLDPTVCLISAAAILVSWWLLPRIARRPHEGIGFGLAAAAATALIVLVLMILFLNDWLVGKPAGVAYGGGSFWVGAAMAVFWSLWFLSVGTMAIACVAGGYLANRVADAVARFGRAGLASGALLAVIALIVPAGTLYGRTMAGMGFIDLVTRHDTLRPFPARVVVALTVHGQRISLERTVLCQRPLTRREEAVANKGRLPKPHWLPSIKSFGHIFADGSAVFVITPDGCRDLAIARDKGAVASLGNNILPLGFLPLIGWTPDGADIATFDLYIDGTAYARPDAAVQIESVTMFRVDYGSKIDTLDTLAKIGWQTFPSREAAYGGYFATAIPPAVWRRNKMGVSQLGNATELGFVFGNLHWRRGLSNEDSLPHGLRTPHIARNGTGIPEEPSRWVEGYGPAEQLKRIPGPVMPLRRAGDTWVLNPAETGVLVFYRGLKTTVYRPPLPETVSVGVRSARRVDGREDGRYLYDPTSADLYMISTTHFRVARPESVFASWQP